MTYLLGSSHGGSLWLSGRASDFGLANPGSIPGAPNSQLFSFHLRYQKKDEILLEEVASSVISADERKVHRTGWHRSVLISRIQSTTFDPVLLLGNKSIAFSGRVTPPVILVLREKNCFAASTRVTCASRPDDSAVAARAHCLDA